MTRTFLCLGVVAALASVAHANPAGDELGDKGQVILSADRLSPLFSYSRIKTDGGNGDSTTNSTTSINLLWSGAPQDFYDIPRVGFDYVVAPHITIGGDLFATLPISASQSSTQGGTTTSRDTNTTSAVGLGLRGGYIATLTPSIALWARGGLSYTYVNTKTPDNGNNGNGSQSTSQLGLNLEPVFLIMASHHVGFVVGPVFDIPLTGNQHSEATILGVTTSTDRDTSQFHFGITAGLVGVL